MVGHGELEGGWKRIPMLGNGLFCLMLCLMCLKCSSNVAVPPAKTGKHPSCCVCVVHVYTRSLLEAIHTSVEL